ncbi:MAG: FHA domain-containing protein [Gemmatimonadota bacterium]|nr:FHA domain-containing protein [Gemmatimonadota bacterium]
MTLAERPVNSCGFCGRDNEEQSKFCIDCGKPVVAGGARVISVAAVLGKGAADPSVAERGSQARGAAASAAAGGAGSTRPKGGALRACPGCSAMIDPALPFCPQCGVRATPHTGTGSGSNCTSCGNSVQMGVDKFCAKCGARVATANEAPPKPKTAVFTAKGTGTSTPKIAIIDDAGAVKQTITIDHAETSIGRIDGDMRFPSDPYLSPMHAQFSFRDGQLFIRDLGSRNGTWLFIDTPYRLQDGDTILIGSQILRFRRLGYPGPHPPEADQTRRLGSLTPNADVALLAQLRADGSARDTCHLSPGRTIKIGREEGDWVFPFDQTMSGRHAEIRGEDLEFIVIDDGSRNGIAVSVRGERPVKPGQKLLMGDQTMRVESL